MALKLVIVGCPNVGKSTLFNRLVGKRIALVDNQPGVTRDHKEAKGWLADLPLTLVDTAGFEDGRDDSLQARMRRQTQTAIREAELALFLIDARAGVTAADEQFAAILRRADMPTILVANKAEGKAGQEGIIDAWRLGLGQPIALSGAHGEGFAELYAAIRDTLGAEAFGYALSGRTAQDEDDVLPDCIEQLDKLDASDPYAIVQSLPSALDKSEDEAIAKAKQAAQAKPVRLAIVGRPNVGKSTLINQLLGTERLLTGPEAGITRDSITVSWTWQGRSFRLIDTAGLRKRTRSRPSLEQMAAGETVRSLKYADIVALVMDPENAFEKQDLQIADLVLREGRALVFTVSKWDQVSSHGMALKELERRLKTRFPQAKGAGLVTLSGLTGRRIGHFLPAVTKAHDDWCARVKTSDLNRWLHYMTTRNPPPSVNGKPIKPRYMAQIKARPPTFVLMASRGAHMPTQYKRYLVNGLCEAFNMPGIPVRLIVRQGHNPYADKPRRTR